MAERFRSSMFPDVARYAHQSKDGTIHYFESDGKKSSDGTLPPGSDPAEVEAQGFTFLNEDEYARTQRSLDPIVRAEDADADTIANAWDSLMGGPNNTPQKSEPQSMNGQPGGAMDPNTMAIIQQYMNEGRLDELFQPFQQEQDVLNQQMAMAQQTRQPGRERNTPSGAILGGLANAIGNIGGAYQQNKALEGQKALGGRMQKDASGRTAALMELLQRAKGVDPKTGLMGTAVDDATLAPIMGGGM